jgi:hypothetical protein
VGGVGWGGVFFFFFFFIIFSSHFHVGRVWMVFGFSLRGCLPILFYFILVWFFFGGGEEMSHFFIGPSLKEKFETLKAPPPPPT